MKIMKVVICLLLGFVLFVFYIRYKDFVMEESIKAVDLNTVFENVYQSEDKIVGGLLGDEWTDGDIDLLIESLSVLMQESYDKGYEKGLNDCKIKLNTDSPEYIPYPYVINPVSY